MLRLVKGLGGRYGRWNLASGKRMIMACVVLARMLILEPTKMVVTLCSAARIVHHQCNEL